MSFARRTHPIKKKYSEYNFFKDDVIEDTITEKDLEKTPKSIQKEENNFAPLTHLAFILVLAVTFFSYSFYMVKNIQKYHLAEKSARYEDYFLTYFEHLQVLAAIQKITTNAKSLDLNQNVVNHLLKTNDDMTITPLKEQRTYAAFEDKIQISYSNLNSRTCKLLVQTISEKPTLNRISSIVVNNSQTLNPKETINSKTFSCSNSSNTLQINVSNI